MRGLIKLLLFLSLLSGTAFADFPPLRVEEKDGFPNGTATKLKFDNGTVSKSGTTFSIKTGNPFNQTLNTTDNITFNNGTFTGNINAAVNISSPQANITRGNFSVVDLWNGSKLSEQSTRMLIQAQSNRLDILNEAGSDYSLVFCDNISIGAGTAASHNNTITFDGNNSDGILTWVDSLRNFALNNNLTLGGNLSLETGKTMKIGGNYTLPINNGTNTQVLKSNGDGTVSWAADAQGAGGNSLYINESATAKGSTVSANVSIVFDKEDFNLSAGDEVNITFNHTMTDLWNAKGTSNFTANQDLNSTNATTFGTVNITSGLTVGNISCTNAIRAGGTSNITALNITGGITAQNFTAIANINGATLGSDASVSDVELRYINNTTSNLVNQFTAKLAITDTGGSLTALNGGNVSSDGILLHNQTKSLSIFNITDSHDILMWKTVKAITIIDVRTVCTGGTSVTGTIAECNATGQLCANSNATWVTAAGTQATNGTMTDAAYDANDWVMWNTTATSGTPSNFAVTITYNE